MDRINGDVCGHVLTKRAALEVDSVTPLDKFYIVKSFELFAFKAGTSWYKTLLEHFSTILCKSGLLRIWKATGKF